jgi:hypothetical protein
MMHEVCAKQGPRELTPEEIALVAGGTQTRTYWDGDSWVTERWSDDGSQFYGLTADYDTPAPTDYDYWEVGFSFGIGFGLYGTDEGMGIEWNAGVGAYVNVGTADTQEEANSQVGGDQVVIGVEDPSLPTSVDYDPNTGDIDFPAISGRVGIYGSSADPISPYDSNRY